jgi:putative CRISPR-associated protein (TIGR02620 family)
MAEYYIQVKKIFPLNNKERVYVGPFDRKVQAEEELEKIKEKVRYEIITNPQIMPKTQDSVMAEVVSKTIAVRSGMKKSREIFPLKIDDLSKKDNGNKLQPIIEIVRKRADLPLIVSRYSSTVEWLESKGVEGEVVERPNPSLVQGRVVYGQLPYRLAALAKEVRIVDLPKIRYDAGGKELSAEDLDEAGANIQEFRIIKLTEEWRKVFEFLENKDNFDYVLGMSM